MPGMPQAPKYTYDSAAFQDGAFNITRLYQEVITALPGVTVISIQREQGKVKSGPAPRYAVFQFSTQLSDADKAKLDVVVSTHRDDAHHLPSVKRLAVGEIDAKTAAMIERGVTFTPPSAPDGALPQVFSLSDSAQRNISGTDLLRADPAVQYPITWPNINDTGTMQLQSAEDVHAFTLAAFGYIRACIDSGTALKKQVMAATTVEGVQTVQGKR
jgi:hypothetical protein